MAMIGRWAQLASWHGAVLGVDGIVLCIPFRSFTKGMSNARRDDR
jgi:hypothetical protein